MGVRIGEGRKRWGHDARQNGYAKVEVVLVLVANDDDEDDDDDRKA